MTVSQILMELSEYSVHQGSTWQTLPSCFAHLSLAAHAIITTNNTFWTFIDLLSWMLLLIQVSLMQSIFQLQYFQYFTASHKHALSSMFWDQCHLQEWVFKPAPRGSQSVSQAIHPLFLPTSSHILHLWFLAFLLNSKIWICHMPGRGVYLQ